MTTGDPGLQAQRTALAWGRTSLALLVNALVVLRAGASHQQQHLLLLGALLLFVAAGGMAIGEWRRRSLERLDALAAPPPLAIGLAVLATWLACAAGVITIVVNAG